jgi:hypothetical protein
MEAMTENHFEDEEWADFVRSTASTELKNRIQAHVDRDCTACGETLEVWKSIAILASRELSYEVPSTVGQSLTNCFNLRRKIPVLSLEAKITKLVFDSFLDPLPAGVRGEAFSGRRLLHETEDFYIDLSLETRDGGTMQVTGQILRRNGQSGVIGGTCVLFLEGEKNVLAQTIANSNEEFQQEIERRRDLRIFLRIPDTQLVCVELPDLERPDSTIN